MKRFFSFVVSVVFFVLSGCGGDRANDPIEISENNVVAALEQAVDYSIIPAVDEFVVQANSLQLKADGFCQQSDESSLIAVQQAWRDLFKQWYRLSLYNFGPLDNDPVFPVYTFIDSLRLRGTNYLATVRTDIASDMAGSALLTEAYYGSKTFQRVGLLALESAVFETLSGDNSLVLADILSEYESNPRKCVVLKNLALQVLDHASHIQLSWETAFADSGRSYRTLFLAGELEDATAPLTLLITSVQSYLDYLQQRNVVAVAASLSGISWGAIAASIDEVESLLEGTDQTTFSFIRIMESAGAQVGVESIRANIAEIRESIAQRNADMLDIALGKLDGNFKREIPDGLEVELGINFSDGD